MEQGACAGSDRVLCVCLHQYNAECDRVSRVAFEDHASLKATPLPSDAGCVPEGGLGWQFGSEYCMKVVIVEVVIVELDQSHLPIGQSQFAKSIRVQDPWLQPPPGHDRLFAVQYGRVGSLHGPLRLGAAEAEALAPPEVGAG